MPFDMSGTVNAGDLATAYRTLYVSRLQYGCNLLRSNFIYAPSREREITKVTYRGLCNHVHLTILGYHLLLGSLYCTSYSVWILWP